MFDADVIVVIMACNEERRIGVCLKSLPLDEQRLACHVVVNGSSDNTAAIAREVGGERVTVHDWPQRGKALSWNRIMLDSDLPGAAAYVFVDGDAEVVPGSIDVLVSALAADPAANAASALPCNGRAAEFYRKEIVRTRGLFGDLYALSGNFVDRLRASHIRLPDDFIGDDSLIGDLAKTDLGKIDQWRESRVVPCPGAGFLCEPISLLSPSSLRGQYSRMINYAQRRFQNQIVAAVLKADGPQALPSRLAQIYPQWLPRLTPRRHPVWGWFDRMALRRMRAAAGQTP